VCGTLSRVPGGIIAVNLTVPDLHPNPL